MTPPPTKLGQFRLEPSAGCGDLISARVRIDGEPEKVEQAFIIKKVQYRYQYQKGQYRMVGKGAQVKMASRDALEKFYERMLPRTDDEGLTAQQLDLPAPPQLDLPPGGDVDEDGSTAR